MHETGDMLTDKIVYVTSESKMKYITFSGLNNQIFIQVNFDAPNASIGNQFTKVTAFKHVNNEQKYNCIDIANITMSRT